MNCLKKKSYYFYLRQFNKAMREGKFEAAKYWDEKANSTINNN